MTFFTLAIRSAGIKKILNFQDEYIKFIFNLSLEKIINNIKGWSNLEFNKYYYSNFWKLCFVNADIWIKSSQEELIFIKWRKFYCSVNIKEIKDKFWFEKDDVSQLDNSVFLHLKDPEGFELCDYARVEDKEETKLFESDNSAYISENSNNWEFIVSMKYLDSVNIYDSQASEIINSENGSLFINEIIRANTFTLSIELSNLIKNFDQYTTLLLKIEIETKFTFLLMRCFLL